MPAPIPPVFGAHPHRPGLALAAAIVIPGAGQAYNGYPFRGFWVLLGSPLLIPYFLGIWGAYRRARAMAAAGGRASRGGFAWIVIHAALAANLLLYTLIVLTMTGVLS